MRVANGSRCERESERGGVIEYIDSASQNFSLKNSSAGRSKQTNIPIESLFQFYEPFSKLGKFRFEESDGNALIHSIQIVPDDILQVM